MNTVANSISIEANHDGRPHFPNEGLCVGALRVPNGVLPALINLRTTNGTCFLYNSDVTRKEANNCLERIAWRMALCLPVRLCEFLIYNGGTPGDSFGSLNKLDQQFFKSSTKVLFDAYPEEFTKQLASIYSDLAPRRSAINNSGKTDLVELNESEGDDAKIKYTFVFVSDFPRVSDEQRGWISKLLEADCSRSGVYVFYSWNMEAALKEGFDYQGLLNRTTVLFPRGNRFYFKNTCRDDLMNRYIFNMDGEDVGIRALEWLNVVNSKIEKESSVSVSLREEVLTENRLWKESSRYGVEVPIGKISSKEQMMLKLSSSSMAPHGLIVGGSGSGKSTLLHDLIIHGAWLYSPNELQFILLDLKSVEFGLYRHLPHVKVLSTNSDREYGLNVLAYITQEIDKRKRIFASNGVAEITDYKDEQHPMPRLIVVIDEFQKLYENEHELANSIDANISNLINKNLEIILREGRSFGIHLLLATQEISSIDNIDNYLNKISIRIALQGPEKGKLLTPDNPDNPENIRQYEGLYNDCFGQYKESRQPHFKIVHYGQPELGQKHREVIEKEFVPLIIDKAVEVYGLNYKYEKYFYQGGGTASLTEYRESFIDYDKFIIHVGLPLAVKPKDVSFELVRKQGNNILIVGANTHDSDTKYSYFESLIRLIYSQFAKTNTSKSAFVLCYSSNDDIDISGIGPKQVKTYLNDEGLTKAVQLLNKHLDARADGRESSSDKIIFALVGLRIFDVSNVKNDLIRIISKGSEFGIHVLLHATRFDDYENSFQQVWDSSTNTMSISPEQLLREFEIKIEMKGESGEGLISGRTMFDVPDKDYIANIQTKDGGKITKFSIYRN